MTLSDDEWEKRILCSDGNCIGIIGPDGRCKTCGKPYAGDLPQSAEETESMTDAWEDASTDAPQVDNAVDDASGDDSPPADSEWENRTLCIDESCIGVVGPDGRCKECGKPYPG